MLADRERELVVILMGSEGDRKHADEVAKPLARLGIEYHQRVGSAHKTPEHVIRMVQEYRQLGRPTVYITIAGRSDALSAFVAGMTESPVIAAPPYNDKYGGMDILSSLRVPSGIATSVAIEPEAAALSAARIFALHNPKLRENLLRETCQIKQRIYEADGDLTRSIVAAR